MEWRAMEIPDRFPQALEISPNAKSHIPTVILVTFSD